MAVATVVLTAGLGIVLTPAASSERVKEAAANLPLVGATIERLVDAAAMYRTHRGSLYQSILLGICTHCLLITGIWSISRAIPINAPGLTDMVLIAPMSLFVGAIPATPGGLGTFEATMEFLYLLVGGQEGDGTVAALTYRVATYVVASIGGIYYAASRSGIEDAIHEAEELAESGVAEPMSDEMM